MLSQWSNCSSSTIKFISSVKKSIYHDKHFICAINILWLSLNKSNTLLNRNEKSPQCLLKIIVRVNSIFTFYNPIFGGHFRPPPLPPLSRTLFTYVRSLVVNLKSISVCTYLSSGQSLIPPWFALSNLTRFSYYLRLDIKSVLISNLLDHDECKYSWKIV